MPPILSSKRIGHLASEDDNSQIAYILLNSEKWILIFKEKELLSKREISMSDI